MAYNKKIGAPDYINGSTIYDIKTADYHDVRGLDYWDNFKPATGFSNVAAANNPALDSNAVILDLEDDEYQMLLDMASAQGIAS